jgi:hypothetical protein
MALEGYAAVFIDFENVYYTLKNSLPEGEDVGSIVMVLLRDMKVHIESKHGAKVIVQRAYADFQRVAGTPQGDLYLLGIRPSYILGTEHKNAADMLLCIEIMDVLYTRTEIEHFFLVAGDRDYIPVVNHLKERAKDVHAFAFQQTAAQDLLDLVGAANFFDLSALLPPSVAARMSATPRKSKPSAPPAAMPKNGSARTRVTGFQTAIPITVPDEREALGILLGDFGEHPEVYISPYLYRLEREMPQLNQHGRRQMVTTLRDAGAVKVEKREGIDRFTGERNEFSVMIINWDHPTVRELNPG